MGDIGGLFDGLFYIFNLLLAPLQMYSMRDKLLVYIFKKMSLNGKQEVEIEKKLATKPMDIKFSKLFCCSRDGR